MEFLNMDYRKSWVFSIFVGLVTAGLFSATLYAFATPPDSAYAPGEITDPTCTPGSQNCRVAGLATYSFGSNSFLGSADFQTSGTVRAGTLGTSVYTLPTTDGQANQVLTTNGTGTVTWKTPSAYADISDVSGNVGIGTTSPGAKLDVSGGVNISNSVGSTLTLASGLYGPELDFGSSGSGGSIRSNTNNQLVINSPSNGIVLGSLYYSQSNGNVGIGTTTPEYRLQSYSNTGAQIMASGYSQVAAAAGDGKGTILIGVVAGNQGRIDYNDGDNTNFYIDNTYNNAAAAMNFRMRTNGTPVNAMTILGSGNVGIGTTSPGFALDVAGVGRFTTGVITQYASGDSDAKPTGLANGQLEIYHNTTDSTDTIYYGSNSGTHYATMGGSIVIPGNETTDPVSGNKMKIGDFVLGMVDKSMGDSDNPNSALHANWVTWDSVKTELIAEIQANGGITSNSSGTIGTGAVSGVSTDTLLAKVTNVLGTLGISIANGVTSIANLKTNIATVKYLQMTTPSGDIYCTWIDNDGNMQKVKGNCDSGVTVATTAVTENNSQAPVSAQSSGEATQGNDNGQQALNVAQQAVQVAQQAAASAQAAANSAQQSVQQNQTPAPTVTTSKNSLEAAIVTAQTKNQASYTQDSWTAMQTALTAGQSVDANASAVQQDVDTATTNLVSSIANLVVVPATPIPTAQDSATISSAGASLMLAVMNFLKTVFSFKLLIFK